MLHIDTDGVFALPGADPTVSEYELGPFHNRIEITLQIRGSGRRRRQSGGKSNFALISLSSRLNIEQGEYSNTPPPLQRNEIVRHIKQFSGIFRSGTVGRPRVWYAIRKVGSYRRDSSNLNLWSGSGLYCIRG